MMVSVSMLLPERAPAANLAAGGSAADGTVDIRLDLPGIAIRTDLVSDAVSVPTTGRRLLTFAQLSDIHLVDEGSPLRTEFLDPWMGTAYRPQEALTPQVLERMTVAVRAARSPLSGHAPELVITTGDNTDTGQQNEVRWFIDLLDGGVIDPDSGLPGTCGTDPAGPRSVAWPGEGRGYDPESGPQLAGRGATPLGAAPPSVDGPGYAANAAANLAAGGRPSALMDHPGLRAAMNRPFVASGLGLPWYASFGNHDALVQGNAPLSAELIDLASGCVKTLDLPTPIRSAAAEAGASGGRDAMMEVAFSSMAVLGGDPAAASLVRRVPGDPARIPLTKQGFIAEHFRTRGSPSGHGFGEWNLRAGEGYYALMAAPGVRLIALDTVNEAGGHQGNLDAAQFAWLHAQLLAADAAGDAVVAYGHHSLASMTQQARGAHLGGDVDGRPARCPRTPAIDPVAPDESVRCLLLRHHSVVALVTGHEHRNRIVAHRPEGAGTPGGFWEIVTASHIEWPQESRLIELVDAGDQLVIVTSMIEHSPTVDVTRGLVLDGTAALAAIARDLSFADPQARNGRDGTADPSGAGTDRDALLLVARPDPGP